MADNVIADPGAGGATFATDDDGVAHHPYTKIEWGADNAFNKTDDAAGKRLPVKIGEELPAGTQSIGSVTVVGVATAANQTTGNTSLATIAGAVAGAEMQVDVLTMPTVTVNAHAVTNAGVFVAQVDGAALTALQLIDDPVQVLGTDVFTEGVNKGVTLGAVRRDADTTLASLTNEFAPLQVDARGALKVEVFSGETLPVSLTSTTITGSVAVTNAGTFASQESGAALTSLQLIDDAVYASDGALNKTIGIGAVFDDVASVAITENQAGYVRMSSRRALLVEGVASGTVIPVSLASTTVTGTVTVDSELPAAAAAADNFANPTTSNIMAMGMLWDGATWDREVGNSVDGTLVNLGANNDVTITSGTVTTVSTVTAVTSITNAVTVAGGAAHASPVSGNPVLIAGRASTAVPVDVGADGDAASIWTNRFGAVVVTMAPHMGLIGSPYTLTSKTAQYTTTQTSAVLQAGGVTEKVIVTKIQVQVGGTTAGTVQIYFGTGAYVRGTNLAIFDGEFAPSATLKPGVIMDGPFISSTNGDDVLVTTSANVTITITIWYYLVV